MNFFFVLPVVCICSSLLSQNLVVNPGFEEFVNGPSHGGFSGRASDFKLPGWSSPTLGTPDYFRGHGNGGVPVNWAGISNAYGGRSYAGIISGVCGNEDRFTGDYREYLQGKLSESLVKGAEYQIEFYFKLSGNSNVTIDRVGLLILDSAISIDNDRAILQKPTLDLQRSEMEAGEWELASVLYTAKGGERNFIIGNFYGDAATHCTVLEFRSGKSDMLNGKAYFYVDDVSIKLINAQNSTAGIRWTTGEAIIPEKNYRLNNIEFAFDSHKLTKASFLLLDSVCQILKQRPTWRIEIYGYTDDVGDEDYNQDLSLRRAISVAEYLQGADVNETRISTLGYGSSKPLVEGRDEASRQINRRVEVRFIIE